MRKAQAAMEFLMTYGWAILVVLAAIAALAYFGVLSPTRFLPETCTFPAGFTCVDKAVISDANNRIDFALKNNQGFRLNITGVADDPGADDNCGSPSMQACTGVGCTPAALPSGGLTFENDQQGVVRISCSAIGAGRFSADVGITYFSHESGLTHTVYGQVRGEAS
ncbi:hypothetical protein HYV82_06650 [Candidatus Woesearchaeota archaeon]|nr:hypothetical protein [Candidatus Woesearchaeota archaeon]